MKALNVALAIALHCLVGAGFLLATQFSEFSDGRLGVAALLWCGGLFFMLDARDRSPGGIWLVPVVWPFAAWYTALGVLVLVGGLIWVATRSRPQAASKPALAAQGAGPRAEKLRAVEATLATLEAQLRDLLDAPSPAPAPATSPSGPALPAYARRAETQAPRTASRPERKSPLDRELTWSDLLGARTLAWAGGVVTVLGILFLFVLAANRGWLLPEIRLALGATASIAAFSAGFWLRRRFGSLHSAVAAAGAGIAGAYGTLLAAAALYHFVPQAWALVAAAAIAAVGAATALAWSSQTVAGLGLLGALLVPLSVFVQDGELSFVGTAFAGLMLIGTAAVTVRMGWRDVLLLAGAASLVQIAGLAAQTGHMSPRVLGLALGFWLLYLGIGLAWQVRLGRRSLEPVAGVFVITGGALAAYSCLFLLESPGPALAAVAGAYAVLAALFFRLAAYRELSSVLGAVAAIVGALAAGELISGPSLATVWAAVAILLAWLARRAREPRLFLVSLGYGLLATGYALFSEAAPGTLFDEQPHPGSGALAVVVAGAALALFALLARGPQRRADGAGPLGRVLDRATDLVCADARPYLWSAGVLGLYAASLGVLELFARVSDFGHGHVALTGLWTTVGLTLTVIGGRLGRQLDIAGLVLLTATAVEAIAFDADQLGTTIGGVSCLIVAGGVALAGFDFGRRAVFAQRLVPAGAGAIGGAALGLAGIAWLTDGEWHGISIRGGAFALVALVYFALAATVFGRHRDLSTIYWSVGLAVGTVALTALLQDIWIVLAGASCAGALVLLGRRAAEERLEFAGIAAFGLVSAYTLGAQAPPSDLFHETAHPAAGASGVLALVGAASVGALALSHRSLRLAAGWLAVGLALYAASLGVLEAFVWRSDFEWGHVALAGLWGMFTVLLLEVGLRRNRLDAQLAAAALGLFALAELLTYDWAELSPTRAAIASLILAVASITAGLEYGRLSSLRARLVPAGIAIGVSAGLAALGVVTLADGHWFSIDVEGGALVLTGVLYTLLAVPFAPRERDLGTGLWALGLLFAAAGLAELVGGFWLVLAGALLATAAYLVGEKTGEERLQLASVALYCVALFYALASEAPPRDFLVESAHPGHGVPSLLVLAAAGSLAAWRARGHVHAQRAALAAVGGILFYGISLALLELAEVATDADIGTKFQRGHTAVSVFWGLVSLGSLYVGLTRRKWELRAAGFALFGISLAKLFLYDLAFLSSLTRALSFLAVGAVLLFAGFFYQRLSEQLDSTDGAGKAA